MVSLLALMALHFTGPAAAVPVGDPVPRPKAGRIRVDARVGSHRISEKDSRCQGSTGCSAQWTQSSVMGGLHLAVIKGLGLYGELGLGQDRIRAADYRGNTRAWAAGLRAAVPLSTSLWIAGNVRMDRGQGESQHQEEEEDPETSEYRIYSGTLLGVWGDRTDGASLWVGGQSSWEWEHRVWPLGTSSEGVRLEVPLRPDLPASGVVGCGFTSEPLGLPWRATSLLTVAIEGRAGQELGVSGWIGLAL